MKPNVCPVGASTEQCVMVRMGWTDEMTVEESQWILRVRALAEAVSEAQIELCCRDSLINAFNRINAIDFRAPPGYYDCD